MNNPDDAVSTQSSNPAAALFEREWLTYRKMVDNNYTFHREAYGELHRVLADDAVQPFRFLDIACGDASMAATRMWPRKCVAPKAEPRSGGRRQHGEGTDRASAGRGGVGDGCTKL